MAIVAKTVNPGTPQYQDALVDFGAKVNELIGKGEYWRFVTPMFIHIGAMHLLVNMYSLYMIGPPVERLYGTARFLVMYVLSGIGGVACSYLTISSDAPSAAEAYHLSCEALKKLGRTEEADKERKKFAEAAACLLVVGENGYGKRTRITEYPRKGRGGIGVKTVQLTEAKGRLAGARIVKEGYQVMLITTGGTMIRMAADGIKRAGRATQGVIVMRLRADEKVSSLAPVVESEAEKTDDDDIDVEAPLDGAADLDGGLDDVDEVVGDLLDDDESDDEPDDED